MVYSYLIKSILYGIWHFRNAATFYNDVQDHGTVINYIIHSVTQRIRLDYITSTSSTFREIWSDSLCNVVNDDLKINL